MSRFWKWKPFTWVTAVTWPVHLIFDAGVLIYDTAAGVPELVRKAKRMVEKPAEIRRQRREELEAIVEGGTIPGTAGPQTEFKQWQKDVTDVSLSVPGTSLKGGPPPTSVGDIATDLLKDTVVDAINEKECPKQDGQ